MPENIAGLFQRDKYVDPKYRKQIEDWEKTQNLEKGKRIAGAMSEVEKGHLLKGLAHSLGIASDIREEIKAGDTSAFPYLLGLAILVDLVDFIPVVGLIVKFVAKPILIYGTFFRGRMKYKWGIKITFIVLSFIEIIPVIDWLPLETLSILMLWRATVKAREEKESEEEENNQVVEALSKKVVTYDTFRERMLKKAEILKNTQKTKSENQPQSDNQTQLKVA